MSKAIITLTTDFGEKDHFVGAVKGAIYSELDTIKIVVPETVTTINRGYFGNANVSGKAMLIQTDWSRH